MNLILIAIGIIVLIVILSFFIDIMLIIKYGFMSLAIGCILYVAYLIFFKKATVDVLPKVSFEETVHGAMLACPNLIKGKPLYLRSGAFLGNVIGYGEKPTENEQIIVFADTRAIMNKLLPFLQKKECVRLFDKQRVDTANPQLIIPTGNMLRKENGFFLFVIDDLAFDKKIKALTEEETFKELSYNLEKVMYKHIVVEAKGTGDHLRKRDIKEGGVSSDPTQ